MSGNEAAVREPPVASSAVETTAAVAASSSSSPPQSPSAPNFMLLTPSLTSHQVCYMEEYSRVQGSIMMLESSLL